LLIMLVAWKAHNRTARASQQLYLPCLQFSQRPRLSTSTHICRFTKHLFITILRGWTTYVTRDLTSCRSLGIESLGRSFSSKKMNAVNLSKTAVSIAVSRACISPFTQWIRKSICCSVIDWQSRPACLRYEALSVNSRQPATADQTGGRVQLSQADRR